MATLQNGILRWGICSTGMIANRFTAALKLLPESEHQIAAVAARQLDRAQQFADKFGIPQAYGSYEELAKDPNIGSIYMCNEQMVYYISFYY